MKLKTYVITLSKMFLQGHPRAGQPTNFRESFEQGLKIHTIRCNYDLWAKRLDEVIAGRAVLSVRQWSGKPYGSKQESPIRILTKDDGVGYQKITQERLFTDHFIVVEFGAHHDGLSHTDFYNWFDHKPTKEPYIIIHFTPYRY
jgi:hypothetical protein